jgi:hypothetical protein
VALATTFSGGGSASTFCKPAASTAKGDGYEKRMMRITWGLATIFFPRNKHRLGVGARSCDGGEAALHLSKTRR